MTDNSGATATRRRNADGPNQAADRLLHRHAEPGDTGQTVSFNASALDRPRRHDRQIRVGPRRQRQLSRPNTGTTATTSRTYATRRHGHGRAAGDRQRRATATATRRRDRQQPRADVPPSRSPRTPRPPRQTVTFNGAGLDRPRRHDRQIRVGPRRQRHLRDQHRHDRDHDQLLTATAHAHRRPAGDRQQRRHGDDDALADRQQRLPRGGPRDQRNQRPLAPRRDLGHDRSRRQRRQQQRHLHRQPDLGRPADRRRDQQLRPRPSTAPASTSTSRRLRSGPRRPSRPRPGSAPAPPKPPAATTS